MLIDIFSKNARVIPLKDERGITVSDAFQKHLKKFNWKPNKLLVDKSSEFYNRSTKLFFQNSNIEMYSADNKGRSKWQQRDSNPQPHSS